MKRHAVLSILTLLVVGCVLSACTVTVPDLSQFERLYLPQVVNLEQDSADTFEQVGYADLPAYEAWLAGYQVAPSGPAALASRFEQIADCQCLAEYEAYIAGFQVAPEMK